MDELLRCNSKAIADRHAQHIWQMLMHVTSSGGRRRGAAPLFAGSCGGADADAPARRPTLLDLVALVEAFADDELLSPIWRRRMRGEVEGRHEYHARTVMTDHD